MDEDLEGESWFLNHYRCDACDEEWSNEWSCACNDACPTCGHEIEPCEYEELDA